MNSHTNDTTIQHLVTEKQRLVQELRISIERNCSLEQQHQQDAQSLINLERKVATLANQSQKEAQDLITQERVAHATALNNVKEEAASWRVKWERAESEVVKTRQSVFEGAEEREKMGAALEALQQEKESLAKLWRTKVECCEAEMSKVRQRCEDLEEQVSQYSRTLSESARNAEQWAQNNQFITREKDEAISEIERVEHEVLQQKILNETLQREKDHLVKENNNIVSELQKSRYAAESFKKELENVQRELQFSKEEGEKWRNAYLQVDKDKAALSKEVYVLNASLEQVRMELQHEKGNSSVKIESLMNESQSLKDMNSTLDMKLHSQSNDHDVLSQKCSEQELLINALSARNIELERMSGMYEKMREQFERCASDVQLLAETKASLEIRLFTRESEFEQLLQKHSQAQLIVQDKAARLSDVERALAAVSREKDANEARAAGETQRFKDSYNTTSMKLLMAESELQSRFSALSEKEAAVQRYKARLAEQERQLSEVVSQKEELEGRLNEQQHEIERCKVTSTKLFSELNYFKKTLEEEKLSRQLEIDELNQRIPKVDWEKQHKHLKERNRLLKEEVSNSKRELERLHEERQAEKDAVSKIKKQITSMSQKDKKQMDEMIQLKRILLEEKSRAETASVEKLSPELERVVRMLHERCALLLKRNRSRRASRIANESHMLTQSDSLVSLHEASMLSQQMFGVDIGDLLNGHATVRDGRRVEVVLCPLPLYLNRLHCALHGKAFNIIEEQQKCGTLANDLIGLDDVSSIILHLVDKRFMVENG